MTDLSKQRQTTFGDKQGNCLATCIACIFEIPVDQVPNFCANNLEGDWAQDLRDWLGLRGFTAIFLATDGTDDWVHHLDGVTLIASGPASRGCLHSVLWKNGKLLHDPHPSDEGLLELHDFTVLVPFDTNAWRKR